MRHLYAWLALFFTLVTSNVSAASEIWVVPVKGAIGPAISDYLVREIELSNAEGADLVILKMDTPGGLDSSMRDIIRAITASSVPVATWVGPSGSRAASAGTYILLASHIAAMAEATNLGAATPVALGGAPQQPSSEKESDENKEEATPEQSSDKVTTKTTMEKKVVNDAKAYIKGLAKLHGRNAEWAEKAVSEAASLDAQEALELGVIDYIAASPQELVKIASGKSIKLNSIGVTLSLEEPVFIERVPDWRAEMLAVITNPNVAYILMLIGIYGLLLEFYNPGIGLPGVLGGICLLLAMYALQMMPVNYAGLGLILLGIALMIAEAFSPSFGVLGLGGVVAFVLGSVFLMDSELPGFQIALPLIFGIAIFSVALIIITVGLLLRIRNRKATTGLEAYPGKLAIVSDDFIDGTGRVQLEGALWKAKASEQLKQGDQVTIINVEGLTLTVKPNDRPKG
ncbi:serine protease [Vibrio rotiferianus]|uniref:Serine protease n=1 Tax=Vibrio rotiferianus TaxID=190895 RepID=A0A510IHX5_9VIBR|nr:nodulation protein NfeD [Vibrio rotiferianus]TMX64521.1 serine protease [Vibrio rotiferianus]BBL92056.1 serine protease [Vibrio rotiferianus]